MKKMFFGRKHIHRPALKKKKKRETKSTQKQKNVTKVSDAGLWLFDDVIPFKPKKAKPAEIVVMEWRYKEAPTYGTHRWRQCSSLYPFGFDTEIKEFRLSTYRRVEVKP